MEEQLDRIVDNARSGVGPCSGCPAQEVHTGEYVNPGLLNYDAEIMFMTLDPSHSIDWSSHDGWSSYNAEYSRRFASWRGGKKIAELIRPLGLTLDDVWLGDSVKCPVDNSLYRFEDRADIERSFDHCKTYLVQEVETIDPAIIVTLGADTATRVLEMLFNIRVPNLKAGTDDCGRRFDTEPPVILSPHWSHGWLDRAPSGRRNLDLVQETLVETYTNRSA